MATTIVTKSGSGAPTASDLVAGELAVDLTNKRLYTEDSGGTVLEVGSNPYNFTANHDGSAKLATTATGIDVTGAVTADGLVVNGNVVIDGGATDNTVLVLDSGTANTYLKITDPNSTNGTFIGATADDLNFYPNNSLAVTMTASGNVGIGTSSPGSAFGFSKSLEIKDTTSCSLQINSNDTDRMEIGVSATGGFIGTPTGSTPIRFTTDGTERMRIDASGNVGIGTTSPTSRLHLDGAEDRTGGLTLSAAGQNHTYFLSSDFVNVHNIETSSAAAAHTWQINATERMRIDASGNVLVGKSATAFGTAGVEASASSGLWSTRSGFPALALNRLSTDGSIADFYKDGTAVGSILSSGGDGIVIQGVAAGSGLLFHNSNAILPAQNGNAVDATIDLGRSSPSIFRFKDLYLSGGVYLGGTGAANKLEDYEEGDYQVTILCGTSGTVNLNTAFSRAAYTKVGRLVTVHGFVVVVSVSSPVGLFKINLPFTPASLTGRAGDAAVSLVIQSVVSANVSDFVGTINENDANVYVQLGDATTTQNDSAQQLVANTYIHFSATYSAA